jgi:hypothetical protein
MVVRFALDEQLETLVGPYHEAFLDIGHKPSRLAALGLVFALALAV